MSGQNRDLYEVLGVERGASAEALKAAYRKKARELHPDVNSAPNAEDDFKEVQAAYAILKDDKQRAHYDRFGFGKGPSGPPPPRPGPGAYQRSDFNVDGIRFDDINLDDALRNPFEFFMRRQRQRPPPRRKREVELQITLDQAFNGGKLNMLIDLPDPSGRMVNHRIRLKIPTGAKEGDRLALKDPPCVVVLKLRPHPDFELKDRDLYGTVSITPARAALGGEAEAPTPGGSVKLKIPPGTSSGQKLRLRGRGLPQKPGRGGEPGDLYMTVRISLPKQLSDRQRELYEELAGLD